YAAPEQLAGGAPGTAMDVYGLGGLLHRLLTGLAPQGANAHSPSRRVARDAALSPAHRRERVRLLRGDLDTIVMKALAQRPQDRYPSVDALADDLRRWLARRPIL